MHKRKKGKETPQKKDQSRRGGEKNVHTPKHVEHVSNIPFGEITIEGTSIVKHCTTATKKKSKDKNGFEKRGESIVQK